MAVTRAFKSGNSQAVRIPAELAYEDVAQDLNITRSGDVLIIAPIKPSAEAVAAELRAMAKPSAVEPYKPIELPDRE
jgi:antitoxin VapB